MSSGNRKVVFPNGEILTGQAADAYLEDLFGKQEAADGAYRAESRAEAARTGSGRMIVLVSASARLWPA